jgi:hypothetical protein
MRNNINSSYLQLLKNALHQEMFQILLKSVTLGTNFLLQAITEECRPKVATRTRWLHVKIRYAPNFIHETTGVESQHKTASNPVVIFFKNKHNPTDRGTHRDKPWFPIK